MDDQRTGPQPNPEIDRGVLDEITGGSEDLLREITGEYVEMSSQLIAALKGAFDRRDAAEIARAAHTFKGSSGMIGANGVMRASVAVERAAATGDLEAAAAAFTTLEAVHAATLRVLDVGG